MPAQPEHDTLSRLLELLKALPHHRWATPSELRGLLADRGFEVDLRPVQRDLKALQNSFPLDHNDKGKPHGWRWSAEQALKRSRDDGRIEWISMRPNVSCAEWLLDEVFPVHGIRRQWAAGGSDLHPVETAKPTAMAACRASPSSA